MRLGVFTTAVLAVMLIAHSDALACDCVTRSAEESFASADVVFEGSLVAITPLTSQRPFSHAPVSHAYTFVVTRVLKGPNLQAIIVYSANTDCDARFYADHVYRVYAQNDDGTLRSGACSGNEILPTTEYVSTVHTCPDVIAPPRWSWSHFFGQALMSCGLGVLLGLGTFLWRRHVSF